MRGDYFKLALEYRDWPAGRSTQLDQNSADKKRKLRPFAKVSFLEGKVSLGEHWRCGDTHVWPKAGFEPESLASQVVHHWGTIIITVQSKDSKL